MIENAEPKKIIAATTATLSLPLDALERDRMDGWHYAMLDGTQPPLFYKHPDKDTFVFSYFGTPDTLRFMMILSRK